MASLDEMPESSESSKMTIPQMRKKLCALGLFESGMSRENMASILEAVADSEMSAQRETRETQETTEKKQVLEAPKCVRRYVDVLDRRMPWTLFPNADRLSLAQRTSILIAYKERQRFYLYRRARSSMNFAKWAAPILIPLRKSRRMKYSDDDDVQLVQKDNTECDKRNFSQLIDCDDSPLDEYSEKTSGMNTRSKLKKIKISPA